MGFELEVMMSSKFLSLFICFAVCLGGISCTSGPFQCPDGEIVIPQDCEKAYPFTANEYTVKLRIVNAKLDSIGIFYKVDIKQLSQKFNQNNVTLFAGLRSTCLFQNRYPCDRSIRTAFLDAEARLIRELAYLNTVSVLLDEITPDNVNEKLAEIEPEMKSRD